MTTKAQQSALDNALVAPENQHVIRKCNMRINPGMKPKEPTYQVVLDAFALTTCYPAFLITAEVPVIFMHQFWATVNKHNASYRFKIYNKRFFVNVEVFREILNICPRIPGQEFVEPLSEEEALSFIRELDHSGEIKYITNVIVDHLHQPWRTFASIINKCLCGKDLAYQIDNKDSKKQDKMFYPRFTKIIIRHFLKKDKSISMRNRTFMHTARDDSLLAYKTYYAIASGAEPSKSKKTKMKSDSAISSEETPSKKKPIKAKKDVPSTKKPTTKPKPTKKKVSVKADRGKSLNVLSEVALSEAAQLKEQQRKITGTDEGTDAKPGVPDVPKYDSKSDKVSWGDSGEEDDDDKDDTKDDEGNDDGDDSDGNDDDDDNNGGDDDDDDDANDDDNQEDDDKNDDEEETDSDRIESNRIKIPVLNQSNTEYYEKEEEKVDDEEKLDKEEDDKVTKELYKDVNVNLGNEDAKMTNAESGFEQEEDAHVTLTAVHDAQKTEGLMQSSSVSSDFIEKLLNFENVSPADNEIASLIDTTVLMKNQAARHLLWLPVTKLETDLSEMKEEVKTQLPQILPKAVSDFATLVIEQNVTESLEAVVLAKSFSQPKSTYEAAASLLEYELTKILLDKMEESKSHLRADYKRELYDALVKSYNTDKDLFDTYGEVFTLKRSRDEKDKDQDPSAGSDRGTKRRKSSKEAETPKELRSKEEKSSSSSNDTSRTHHKSSGNVNARAENPPTSFDELIDTPIDFSAFVINWLNIANLTQEYLNVPRLQLNDSTGITLKASRIRSISSPVKVVYDKHAYWGTSHWGVKRQRFYIYASNRESTKDVYFIKRIIAITSLKIMKWYDYGHLDKIEVRREDQQLYTFKEDERYDLNVALRMFTRRIVIQRRVEDLQLGVKSYQKKLNLTKPDTFRSNLRNRTAYTAYSDPQGVIYKDQNNRNRLMRTDELHKFSDGTLNDVRTAPHDIASNKDVNTCQRGNGVD
ncbi:hypothetical protein Tco_0454015 [Tanacetum coccineum]